MNCNEVLDRITNYYLESHDYNGLPVSSLIRDYSGPTVKDCLSELLTEDLISLVFGDYHPNPHIKALTSEPTEDQLKNLHEPIFKYACAYPECNHLKNVVKSNEFSDKPYELCLALGEPQLVHKSFDLSVLELYRNDPRYYYDNDDVRGHISIKDEFYETDKMRDSDQILLESYGFCFDKGFNIYVAVFLRYLYRLSPEHQLIWASKQLDKETHLHPDYYRASIIGDWPRKLSLFGAVLLEIKTVNKLCKAIGREPIFKKDFAGNRRPREFNYLVRPTLKEFNEFIHLLDKMLSENINRKFFKNAVAFESEEERSDGKIIVRQKGTIQLLNDWLRSNFKPEDWSGIDEMNGTFRRIRNLRQKPAHSIKENEFDQKYIHEQRDLMKSVYRALKILRLVLSLHPLARNVEINKFLIDGLIWPF